MRGAVIDQQGRTVRVNARRGVVLAGGAINTPTADRLAACHVALERDRLAAGPPNGPGGIAVVETATKLERLFSTPTTKHA